MKKIVGLAISALVIAYSNSARCMKYIEKQANEELDRALLIENIQKMSATDVNKKFKQWGTLLHWAAHRGLKAEAELLLQKGANVHAQALTWNETPIIFAVKKNRTELVELLLKHAASIAMGPLGHAARKGHKDLALYLLKQGAAINEMYGVRAWIATPLMIAAMHGQLEMVIVLLDAGADVNAKTDDRDFTALSVAILNNKAEIVAILLKRGAKTSIGMIPALHLAAMYGRKEIVEILILHGEKVNLTAPGDRIPLHFAYQYGHKEVIAMLLAQGADNEALDFEGKKPSELAGRDGVTGPIELFCDDYIPTPKEKLITGSVERQPQKNQSGWCVLC